MSIHEAVLAGCTPEPLMGYLKALGVLRLVAEQKDRNAQGYWRDGVFVLRSSLDQAAIVNFFRTEYSPTPIVAPWNAGSGFYLKWDDKKKSFKERDVVAAIDGIEQSKSKRLQPYRSAITAVKQNLRTLANPMDLTEALAGKTKAEKKEFLDAILVFAVDGATMCLGKGGKDAFLATLRSSILDDSSLHWIDVALALTIGRKKNRHEAPLLGSGGNVGNSDFSAMFAQMITTSMDLDSGLVSAESGGQLAASVYGRPVVVQCFSVGQFDPGKAGGANQTQGLESQPQMNPWDFILMCEGALLMSGAIARRTETGPAGASFPFTVRASAIGFGSAGPGNARGEMWAPIWTAPVGIIEIGELFKQGRADVAGKPARDGIGFARAVSSLGTDQGIEGFIRYGYQERLGQSYLANSLGSFEVHARPDVDLLREADSWLDRFRSAASADKVPPRFTRSLRAIESAIFEYCQYGGTSRFANILCSLGRAERELATGEKFREDKYLRPLVGLSPQWIQAGCDDSVEFELALALSGIFDAERKVGPLRANLESVIVGSDKHNKVFAKWAEKDKAVVWSGADLSANLASVLTRRLVDANRKGCKSLPLVSRRSASLEAITSFIAGNVDEEKLDALLWGLMLIDQMKPLPSLQHWRGEGSPPLSRAYMLLKLLFLPFPVGTRDGGVVVKSEPSVLPLLRAGHVGDACALAARRLRASGLVPLPNRTGRRTVRDADWKDAEGTLDPYRLGAALLFPVDRYDVNERLAALVLRRDEQPELAVHADGGKDR
jgi:CRISPR-associated protein Csx17